LKFNKMFCSKILTGKHYSAKGFTMIEVIIAVFVLSLAGIGTFILIQQTLVGASQNRLQLTAYYLGQEGMEIVRNIRDRNWLQGQGWTTGLAVNEDWQEADYQSAALVSSQDRIFKVDSNGFYNYSTGSDTLFKREIRVIQLADCLQVEVVIEWVVKGETRTVEVKDFLYNWYVN